MAAKVTTANTYTDAELVAIYRDHVAQKTIHGESYQNPNGSQFTDVSLVDAMKLLAYYEDRVERLAKDSQGIATNYARLVRS